jgi:hypothetical protein
LSSTKYHDVSGKQRITELITNDNQLLYKDALTY